MKPIALYFIEGCICGKSNSLKVKTDELFIWPLFFLFNLKKNKEEKEK